METQAFSARPRGLLLCRGGVQLPPMCRLSGPRLLRLGPLRAQAPTPLTSIQFERLGQNPSEGLLGPTPGERPGQTPGERPGTIPGGRLGQGHLGQTPGERLPGPLWRLLVAVLRASTTLQLGGLPGLGQPRGEVPTLLTQIPFEGPLGFLGLLLGSIPVPFPTALTNTPIGVRYL